MKYWQIIYLTGGDNFETGELLINDEQYRQVQVALSQGSEFVIVPNKPTIRATAIRSINDAGEIVAEIQRMGVKIDGLLESPDVKKLDSGMEKLGREDILKRMRKNLEEKGIIAPKEERAS